MKTILITITLALFISTITQTTPFLSVFELANPDNPYYQKAYDTALKNISKKYITLRGTTNSQYMIKDVYGNIILT
jgi:hypothetical protein